MTYEIVIPTIGRDSLDTLLRSLEAADVDPSRVVVVDDGPTRSGPAAARNRGVDALDPSTEWVVFLDDDVVVGPTWGAELEADLLDATGDVGAIQGHISVPLPDRRPPTDWERHTARLATAQWITADMAVRRAAFDEIDGFDPSFRRAFREDSDFALRLQGAGWRLQQGRRRTTHPVRPSGFWSSVHVQAGNQEHARMRLRHGRRYRRDLGEGRTVWAMEVLATGALGVAVAASMAGRRRRALDAIAVWALCTAWFTRLRLRPGPRTRDEVARMVVTSVAIPPAAVAHRVVGWWRVATERARR